MSIPQSQVIFNLSPPNKLKKKLSAIKPAGLKGGKSVKKKIPISKGKNEDLSEETKLINLTQNANKILCKVKAVFPFDLFPDEIIVEPSQINVIQRDFFFSETVISIPIKNMADILIETSPFFATIKLIDVAFKSDPITVRFLSISDAQQLRRVIQGLVIADKQHVDTTQLEPRAILPHAEVIGKTPGYE